MELEYHQSEDMLIQPLNDGISVQSSLRTQSLLEEDNINPDGRASSLTQESLKTQTVLYGHDINDETIIEPSIKNENISVEDIDVLESDLKEIFSKEEMYYSL
jgi:hypothetical protein